LKVLFAASVLLSTISAAHATERYHTSTLAWVYPESNGDFIVGFTTDSSQCSATGSPKYMHVVIGQNGITADGSKKMYAAALLALSLKTPLSIAFDDATSYCYINRVTVQN
jgi:hypothetical protein